MYFAAQSAIDLNEIYLCLEGKSSIAWNVSASDTKQILISYQHGNIGPDHLKVSNSIQRTLSHVDPDEEDCVDMMSRLADYESWFTIRYSPYICAEQIVELTQLILCFDGVIVHECSIYDEHTINSLVGEA